MEKAEGFWTRASARRNRTDGGATLVRRELDGGRCESSDSWTNMSKPKQDRRLAICIKTDDPDLLTPRKIYEVIPDSAEKSKFVRVIDNEGEDYLYSASCFIFITLPQDVKKILRRVS
jgi:hypothetical protein